MKLLANLFQRNKTEPQCETKELVKTVISEAQMISEHQRLEATQTRRLINDTVKQMKGKATTEHTVNGWRLSFDQDGVFNGMTRV